MSDEFHSFTGNDIANAARNRLNNNMYELTGHFSHLHRHLKAIHFQWSIGQKKSTNDRFYCLCLSILRRIPDGDVLQFKAETPFWALCTELAITQLMGQALILHI